MRCPFCDDCNSRVMDSRTSLSGIRRRRECKRCGLRFTTYETVHVAAPMIVKADGRREPFERRKLIRGVVLACAKLNITTEQIEQLVHEVELELFRKGGAEVGSDTVGNEVIGRLYHLSPVAYIRYASVYNQFEHVRAFTEAVDSANHRFVPRAQMDLFARDRIVRAKSSK